MEPLEFAEALAHSLEAEDVAEADVNESLRYGRKQPHRKADGIQRAYGRSLDEVELCLKQYVPEMTKEARKEFLFSFFPFMFGIYPYTIVSDKQRTAMN